MSEEIGALLGVFAGAMLLTGVITRVVISMTRRNVSQIHAVIISFFVSALIILLIASFTMGIERAFISYVPCLVLWLIIDLVRINKTGKANTDESGSEKSSDFTCAYCGTKYDPLDYRESALEWICAQCSKPLQKR